MDRRLPISPIPNNLRKNLDSLKEPYSAEGYQGTKATDKDRTTDRTYHTRRDDDTVGSIKIDLKDNDSVIPYYFENVIKPTVVKDGTLIDVPLIYGGAEIWKTVQKDGYYRDKESKIQVPLIMFKRNTVTKRKDIGNKLDGNQAHLFQTFEKKYSSRNQYDNFDILNNRSPEREYHAVVVPDYVTLTYDCIIWTEYVENMNKLVEAINFASDSYWGDPNRWKFKATIDSFQNQTEVTVGGNRIVRTTFTLTLNGYLIPDVYNKALANKTKFSSVTNIKFTDEQFTLQNAQTQPQQAFSTFTTTGPGALTGGGGSSISSSYAETASFAHFATSASYAISASHEIIKEVSSSYADTASFAQSGNGIFSGSFSGNGSGLTNIPSSGIIGLPTVTGTTNTIPIFTGTNAIGNSVITYDGESFTTNLPGGLFTFQQVSGDYVRIFPSQNLISTDGNFLILEGSKGVTLKDGNDTATYTGGALELVSGGGDQTIIRNNGTIEVTPDGGDTVRLKFPTDDLAHNYTLPTATGTIALLNNSGSGDFQATGSFSGSFQGDGSGLTGIDPFPFSGSAVITGSLLVSGSSKPLEVIGSGSTVFSVQGSLGELFAIDDQLSGSLLVVNDISGLPQFEVFSDGRTLIGAEPRSLYTTATINATLAATSQSIYSLSTSSYDGVFFDYTVTSASNARAGNIMSIWNGGNLVYTENTTTDIGSTVGVTFNVEISQSQAQLISVTDTAGWKIKTTIRSI